jgi:branched-chain amino acid transport system ATP-binding protein
MLRVEAVNAFYGKSHILWDVTFGVGAGEVVGLLGRNGMGKTTLLKTIAGQVAARSGGIRFHERGITSLPAHRIARLGLAYVPQDRSVYADFTVGENLEIARPSGRDGRAALQGAFEIFPILKERVKQVAGTLSGGERQMLAIGRAIVKQPSLIMLDEPTEGLMPSAVEVAEDAIMSLRKRGVSILLVEQNMETALRVCDRIYILEKGSIVHEVGAVPEREKVVAGYLGLTTD